MLNVISCPWHDEATDVVIVAISAVLPWIKAASGFTRPIQVLSQPVGPTQVLNNLKLISMGTGVQEGAGAQASKLAFIR